MFYGPTVFWNLFDIGYSYVLREPNLSLLFGGGERKTIGNTIDIKKDKI